MATKGVCEDGCKAEGVWVEVRHGWNLLCDDCAHKAGVLYAPKGGWK